ncbi:MFS transporter [Zavarzinia aquatilis]|uniref:MFS transporter n=1 Tax=Zavarzinia aquatilis TaxID=2211142 RepID=A0A317EE78_9PROT|nr:MFS transporter [Zavarzinia aquatilis]PWR24912.1 MFS transporter [Zavarzinia aquatilis]
MADRSRWLILASVAAAFMPVTIDTTVLYLALPSLTRDLGASGTQVLWIMDIYPLMMAGLVLVTGPLGDRVGQRNLLLAGLGLFGLASLAAAYSWTPALLIGARVLLAFGGSMIIPSTLAIVRRSFTDTKERGIAIGIWGACASAGAAIGPVAGGVILSHFHWGAVFLFNLPILALAALVIAGRLRNSPNRDAAPLHPLAAVIGIAGVLLLVHGIKDLAREGGVGLVSLAALAAGLALLGAFARGQLRSALPMLDLRLFRRPGFAVGVLAAMGPIMLLTGFELTIVQQLQFVDDLSPWDTGLAMTPLAIAAAVAGAATGSILHRTGMRLLALMGLALAAGGYLLLMPAGLGGLIGAMIMIGAGHGFLMSLATATIMGAAPADKAGAAAAIESVSYELGTGLGIALFGSLLGLAYGLGLDHGGPGGGSIGATFAEAAELGGVAGEALRAAGREAFTDAFRLLLGVLAGFALLFGLAIYRLGREKKRLVPA